MNTPNKFQADAASSDVPNSTPERADADSDVISFWLLLLFIATFFGIAAEEARRPSMLQTAGHSIALPIAHSIDGTPLPVGAGDKRTNLARRFDLSSVAPETASAPGKLEIPATGK